MDKYRIRVRYPDGFEFEIEGDKGFIISQKEEILSKLASKSSNTQEDIKIEDSIKRIIDFTDNIPFIKTRIIELDVKMAILIILQAAKVLQGREELTAIELSKAINLSGYNPKRLDRVIDPLLKDESIIAQGSKRKRRYKITEKGLTKSSVKIFHIEQKSKEQTLNK